MWSFYGSKSKIVNKYPKPIYDTIIEPFAGSAKYSLEYWEREVLLMDVDPIICSIWNYLKSASSVDILSLPDIPNATKLVEVEGFSQLCQEEKWLIGFCCNGGSAQPKNTSGRHNFNSWNKDKIRISKNLGKIRHWSIINDSYETKSNVNATWFIDPPYLEKGKWYKYSQIDYVHLGNWCQSRLGQIIVCEGGNANWLSFQKLTDVPFTHFKNEDDKHRQTSELIWYRE